LSEESRFLTMTSVSLSSSMVSIGVYNSYGTWYSLGRPIYQSQYTAWFRQTTVTVNMSLLVHTWVVGKTAWSRVTHGPYLRSRRHNYTLNIRTDSDDRNVITRLIHKDIYWPSVEFVFPLSFPWFFHIV